MRKEHDMKAKYVLFLILAISCILSGCSQGDLRDAEHSQKGRYVEKNIPLPEGITSSTVTLTKKDDAPFLYSFSESPFSITGYRMEKDGTWTEATPEWLKALDSLPRGWSYQPQVMEASNGRQYLYYTELIDDNLKANLICTKDGKTSEVLHPEGWDEVDPDYGRYNFPSRVTILENGSLAALYYSGEVVIYNSEDYKIIYTVSDMNYNSDFLSSLGSKLILAETDENRKIKSILLHDLEASDDTSYPFETKIDSYTYCDIDGKDLLLCNADGIFRLEDGTSLWNTVLDGTLTSLAMPTMWSSGFVCDASDQYYVLYNSQSGYSLMQYVFDETVDTLPTNELNIYALTDNSTLRQAASVFQQAHTDVKVNFTTAMTREEYEAADITIKEDYIRALNTELLAGGNYDILVLDGLPTDSFLEKGVLADISDLIQPMIDDGTLSKNIADTYVENGKIYRIPARYGLPLLFGSMDTEGLTSLEALADYAAHSDSSLFGQMTLKDLINTFTPYQLNLLMGDGGKINRNNLITLLNTLKQLGTNSGIVDTYDGINIRGNNVWNLSYGKYLSLTTTNSFLDAIFPFGMAAHYKGSYTSFANSYQPICELGIISKSDQIELSKEFLRTVLSEEIQRNDLYDGFPINAKALITSSQEDRSMYSVGTSAINEDGSEEMLTFEALDKQQTADVVAICSSVSNRLTKDEHITSAIVEKAKDFFVGDMTVEAAADAVIQEMNVYLSE
jgi:ABC-type glycerol-3-phosphate transport system substrate-binding protein